jgi:hypothetical protein
MNNVNTGESLAANIQKGSVLPAQEVLRQVHDELHELLRQRAEIMRRIGTAKKTIVGLATLFGDSILSTDLQRLINGGAGERKSGFTRTCRAILMESDRALTVREVRDRMRERDPSLLERQKDPVSSITTILNRLADYGEVQRVVLSDNTRGWQWVVESSPNSHPTNGSGVS